MTETEILDDLIALADSAGLRVQRVPRGRAIEGGPPVASAVCRMGAEWRVMLISSDTLEARIDVVASALRDHCGEWLEARHVPPALRERLESR